MLLVADRFGQQKSPGDINRGFFVGVYESVNQESALTEEGCLDMALMVLRVVCRFRWVAGVFSSMASRSIMAISARRLH